MITFSFGEALYFSENPYFVSMCHITDTTVELILESTTAGTLYSTLSDSILTSSLATVSSQLTISPITEKENITEHHEERSNFFTWDVISVDINYLDQYQTAIRLNIENAVHTDYSSNNPPIGTILPEQMWRFNFNGNPITEENYNRLREDPTISIDSPENSCCIL